MTDKELLEKAAKAAGYVAEGWCDEEGLWLMDDNPDYGYDYWNPLDNDGDALRLAVKLRITPSIHLQGYSPAITAQSVVDSYTELLGSDEMAATRRAITRAAAAMVKE